MASGAYYQCELGAGGRGHPINHERGKRYVCSLKEVITKLKDISVPSWGSQPMCHRNCTKRPKDTTAIHICRKRTHAGAEDGVERRAAKTTSSVGTTAGQRTARGEERRRDARGDKTRRRGTRQEKKKTATLEAGRTASPQGKTSRPPELRPAAEIAAARIELSAGGEWTTGVVGKLFELQKPW